MSDEKIVVSVDSDLEDLIPGFLENRAKDLDALRAALQAGDYQAIQSTGHSLKGVGGGYGFDGMSELGAAIEASARDSNAAGLVELIDRLADYLQRVEIVYE